MPSLKERALAAYAEELAARAQAEEEHKRELGRKVADFVERKLGVAPQVVDGDLVIVDGIRMRYRRDYAGPVLCLAGICPRCLADCCSRQEFTDLAGLGEALSQPFEPDYAHRAECPAEPDEEGEPQDFAHRLIALLDERYVLRYE